MTHQYFFSGSLRATLTFLLSSLFSLSALAEAKPQPTTPSLTPVASTVNDTTHPVPLFAVDAAWPTLPDNWILGQVPGLSVDASDNVWIAQRPASVPRLSLGLENRSAICCERAPEVIKFSPDGKMLAAWGGESLAPDIEGVNQWPDNIHGIYADDSDGSVWIAGNGSGDHIVLNFTADGKFVRSFGRRNATAGNSSHVTLGNPADISRNGDDILVADGYVNSRIVRLNNADLSMQQIIGAWGENPGSDSREGDFDSSMATANSENTATDAPHFGDIVHCVETASDGRVYVCDRRNNRLQIFHKGEDGNLVFERNLVVAGNTGGLGTVSDVAFSPDNKYLYVADMMNGVIWILWHDTYEVMGSIGRNGRYAGEFTWLHSVESDSEGNLYTTEVSTGQRVQKFVLTGFSK